MNKFLEKTSIAILSCSMLVHASINVQSNSTPERVHILQAKKQILLYDHAEITRKNGRTEISVPVRTTYKILNRKNFYLRRDRCELSGRKFSPVNYEYGVLAMCISKEEFQEEHFFKNEPAMEADEDDNYIVMLRTQTH